MRGRFSIAVLLVFALVLIGCGSRPSKTSTARAQQRQELQDYWNKASPKVRTCRQIDEGLALIATQLTPHLGSVQTRDLRANVAQLLVLQSETVGRLSTISPPLSLAGAHGRLVELA